MDNAGARPNTGRVRGQQEYRLVRKAFVEDANESEGSEEAVSLPPRSSSNATRPIVGFTDKIEDPGKDADRSRWQPAYIDEEEEDAADDSKPAYPYIDCDARGQRLSEKADRSSTQNLDSDSYKISHDALRRRLTPNPFQPQPRATRRRASSIRSTYANPDPDLDRLSRQLSGDFDWEGLDTWPVPLFQQSDGYAAGVPGGPYQHSQYVPYPNRPYREARHFGDMSEENYLKLERLERFHRHEMLRLHLESQERRQRCELEFRYKIETQRLSFESISSRPRQGQTKFPLPRQDASTTAKTAIFVAKLPPWSAPDDRIRRKYILDEWQGEKREDSSQRMAVQPLRDLAEDTTVVGTTVVGATDGYSFKPIPVRDTATVPKYGGPTRQIGCLIREPVPVPSARPLMRSVIDKFGPPLAREPETKEEISRNTVLKAVPAGKNQTRPPGLQLQLPSQEDGLSGARKQGLSSLEIETEGSTSSGSSMVRTPTTSRSEGTVSAAAEPGLHGDAHSTLVAILQRFCAVHGNNWTAKSGDVETNSHTVGGSDQATAPSSSTGDSYGTPASLLRPSRPSPKRRRPSRDSDSSSDEDRDGKPRRPGGCGNSGKPKKGGDKEVRLACPFRKHDPMKYTPGTHRTCVTSHWSTMGRVKEHIYRSHKLVVCIRCQQEFTSEKHFEAHQRADEPCERKPKISHEGITAEQEKKLRSRKEAYQNRNVEGQWKSAYRILFPGEDPPSPYFEEELDGYAYHEFLRQKLPSFLAASLCGRSQTRNQSSQLLGAEAVPAIVTTCLQTLFQLFQSAQDKQSDPQGPSLPSPQTTEPVHADLDGEDRSDILVEWVPAAREHGDAVNHTPGDVQFAPDQDSVDILKDAGAADVEFSCLGFGTFQYSSDNGTASSCILGCNEPCRHLPWDFSLEAWGMGPGGASQTRGT